jgi:hypothetical protein
MKKILIILSAIIFVLLLAFGIYYFLGNGKGALTDFFQDNTFGSFFDVDPQSRNDFLTTPDSTQTETRPPGPYIATLLRQISFEPVSGYTFYATTSTSTQTIVTEDDQEVIKESIATTTAIRFQERVTGHIYDVFEFIQSPEKVSNITEQKIYSTLFSNNKNQFLFQKPAFNNEQIQSTFAALSFSTSTGAEMTKNIISNTITDFIFNKSSNSLIYSVKQAGVSLIYTANMDRTNEKLVTTLPFNEFIIDTINKNEVLITTKASRSIPGYSYTLNTTNGVLTKILGNINGLLVKVSPDKKYYLYSQSETTRPGVRAYVSSDKTISIVSIDTIPSEKCVFSLKNTAEIYCFGSLSYKAAQYPDDWYKGKVFNIESLYKIDLANNIVTPIYNFEIDDLTLDAMNIQLTNNDEFIIFQNKYDLTLWSLDLSRLSNDLN